MKIKYLGHSCFQLTSSIGTSIITDPYTKVGYELPLGLTADAVTTSHAHFDHNYTDCIKFVTLISTTGTHCVNDIQLTGISTWHDQQKGALRGENIIYKFQIDGLTICHLGDLGEEITPALIEKIGKVNVLLIPVGGTYTIDAKQAKILLEAINPQIAIPMHFKPNDGCLDISNVSVFLQQFSADKISVAGCNELQIDDKRQVNGTQIIYLER